MPVGERAKAAVYTGVLAWAYGIALALAWLQPTAAETVRYFLVHDPLSLARRVIGWIYFSARIGGECFWFQFLATVLIGVPLGLVVMTVTLAVLLLACLIEFLGRRAVFSWVPQLKEAWETR